ncbi:hypothetical protein [Anaerococcus cruorum]|uniref:hypothetical protein n=1 Tax=Anaerococcus sp. WGS1529 TaxID=3366812 RepID=UPI00372D0075
MTEEKRYEEDDREIEDLETGKVEESSQYEGDEELEDVANNLDETNRSNDPDVKYNTDTEYRNTDVDEAGYVSGPTAEGRRTRVDELPENPSEDEE